MNAPRTRIAPTDWPRLLALLDEALDLPVGQRDHWLQGLALPASVGAALQRLLAQRVELEAHDFLVALPALACTSTMAAVPGDRWCAGATAGPWRLLRLLGRGGMSVVWLAERTDGQLKRPVALKLPHAGAGREGFAQRMLRERRILAALEHPHIARLYDVGLTDCGLPYLAMEFVEGQNLQAHADALRLTTAARVTLFQQVLSAVQFAHSHLVLHRDLKPGNILVARTGQVKLLDFGIAKLMAANPNGNPADETDITRGTGHQLTPGYASPEQWLGQPLGVGADVYALGVVLYELLAGCRPHISMASDSPLSAARLQHAVLNEEPLPPSRRRATIETAALRAATPAALVRELQGDLDAVCLKALALLPADRYATADALAADLMRWQTGNPVLARAPGALHFAAKFVRRHRLGVALGSAAVLAVLTTGAAALWQGQVAWHEAQRATMARDFVLGLFADFSSAHINGVQLSSTQLLELGRQRAHTMAGQPQLQAELLAGIGQAQIDVGELLAADAALNRAAQLFRISGDTRQEAAVRLARLELVVGDHRWDVVAHRAAELEPLQRAIQSDRALRWRWLLASGRAALAESLHLGVERLQECVFDADLTSSYEASLAYQAQLSLAHAASFRGRVADAQALLERAQQLPVRLSSPTAAARQALQLAVLQGEILGNAGRFADMATFAGDTVAACEGNNLDPERRRCLPLQLQLAWAHMHLGNPTQALTSAQRMAWTLHQKDEGYARFATAYLMVQALAAAGQTRPGQLPVLVLEDLLRSDTVVPLPVRYQVPGLNALAQLRLRAGDIGAAEALLARAVAVMEHAPSRSLEAERAGIELTQALAAQARSEHATALRSMGSRCNPDLSPSVMHGLQSLNCVRSLMATGQRQRAMALVASAVGPLTQYLGADAPHTRRALALLVALQSPRYRNPPWAETSFYVGGIR